MGRSPAQEAWPCKGSCASAFRDSSCGPAAEAFQVDQASGLLTHSRCTAQKGLELAHATARSPLTCLGLR